MNSEQYRNNVRNILNEWSDQLLEELNWLGDQNFHKDITKLAFEIHYKCDLNLYTMDEGEGEVYFIEPPKDVYYGHRSILKSLDREVYDKMHELDNAFEEGGGDSFTQSSIEVMHWFYDQWCKSSCTKINLEAEIGIHDHLPFFDLKTGTYYEY